jgi:hypothetical protein
LIIDGLITYSWHFHTVNVFYSGGRCVRKAFTALLWLSTMNKKESTDFLISRYCDAIILLVESVNDEYLSDFSSYLYPKLIRAVNPINLMGVSLKISR